MFTVRHAIMEDMSWCNHSRLCNHEEHALYSHCMALATYKDTDHDCMESQTTFCSDSVGHWMVTLGTLQLLHWTGITAAEPAFSACPLVTACRPVSPRSDSCRSRSVSSVTAVSSVTSAVTVASALGSHQAVTQ